MSDMLGSVVADFATLLMEMMILLFAVAAGLALVARRFGVARLQGWLGGGPAVGAVKGVVLGFVTPFCTYSAIPVVYAMAGARLRAATLSGFLLSSPLLDPVVAGGLVLLFGWQVAVAYVVITFVVVLLLSMLAEALHVDLHLRPALARTGATMRSAVTDGSGLATNERGTCASDLFGDERPWRGWRAEAGGALAYGLDLTRGLALAMVAAVAVAAAIVGFVPTTLVADVAGPNNPLAVVVAALVAMPFYVSTAAFLPIAAGLHEAGMGMGATLALVISAAGVNLPELGLLSRLMPVRLLAGYTAAIIATAVAVGYLVPLVT